MASFMDWLNQQQETVGGWFKDAPDNPYASPAAPGQVQIGVRPTGAHALPLAAEAGGQQIAIPRQPWAEGAQAEAVHESPGVQATMAKAGDEPKDEINWAALAGLYSQMNQKPQQAPTGHLPVASNRGRQGPTSAELSTPQMLDAYGRPVQRLLVDGIQTAPRR